MARDWSIARADGSDERTELALADVRILIESGAYGPHDLVWRGASAPVAITSIPALASWLAKGRASANESRRPPEARAAPRPTPTVRPPQPAMASYAPAGTTSTLTQALRKPSPAASQVAGELPEFGVVDDRGKGSADPDLADEEELDISSLIDVVFLLLIFFMVTSVMANPVGVHLPPSETGVGLKPVSVILIGVRAPPDDRELSQKELPTYFVGTGERESDPESANAGQAIRDIKEGGVAALGQEVRKLRSEHPEWDVIIRADEKATFKSVREARSEIGNARVYTQVKHLAG